MALGHNGARRYATIHVCLYSKGVNLFVSEAHRQLEDVTAPTTGPTVLSGFQTTETTAKVST